ncbi:hypothetical protein MAQ5080_00556 [Marinomonas aquimarina]|uniref:DUF4402 domain-containing protein n=1 Tax=Marinomonas aquimarina TaxID=295068 RepID=A0A1A8T5P8_9GAMM|nr:DUF4402 domain-containing protein [Marinomonas aquimarina]SBS26573.1 hypothetical protein MAQ5080_00556 [Marinomonas aquimarina]
MNKLLKLSSLAALVALSGNYALAETATGNASVTVSNAFTLEETTPLSFGTIRAQVGSIPSSDEAAYSELSLPADGSNATVTNTASTGDGTASSINIIDPGTPGTFSVSGAAPNQVLVITPPGAFDLTTTTGGAVFEVSIAEADIRITSGANANRTYSSGTNDLITDDSGSVTFDVGGTLSTDTDGNATNYRDVTYSGTYTMTVEY